MLRSLSASPRRKLKSCSSKKKPKLPKLRLKLKSRKLMMKRSLPHSVTSSTPLTTALATTTAQRSLQHRSPRLLRPLRRRQRPHRNRPLKRTRMPTPTTTRKVVNQPQSKKMVTNEVAVVVVADVAVTGRTEAVVAVVVVVVDAAVTEATTVAVAVVTTRTARMRTDS